MNKEDKQGLIIFGVLMFITIILAILIVLKVQSVEYKYFIGETSGISKKCYVDNEKGCLCLIDNQFVAVDQFYYVN